VVRKKKSGDRSQNSEVSKIAQRLRVGTVYGIHSRNNVLNGAERGRLY